MMKKQYMLFMPAAFCLTLLACTDENLTGNGMTNPDEQPTGETGKVVVDYTLDADEPASRADGSETDSPETSSSSPIRSLTYLLYEKTGTDEVDNAVYTLVKRREIRDITEKTQWPMTRENMTWNQREDLKDTLDRSSEYKVVFVANAAASLHKGEQVLFNASLEVETPEEGEGPQELLLNFTDAYLKMPQAAFTDDNLFYVTTADFKSSENADYVNQSLDLERVVARTELACIANVPGNKAVKARLKTYFYPRIKGYEVSPAEGTIMAQIYNNYTTSVTSLLANGQNLCGDYADYIISAPEGEESVTCENKLKDLLESFQNRPQAFEPAVQVKVLEQLTEGLMPTEDDNPSLFSKQYDWKEASEVKITFSSCADKVGLDGSCRKAEGTDPITWTVPVENGRINLTTFGTGGTDDASVKQKITSLAFYSQSTEGAAGELFTVTCQDAYPLVLDLAANQRISLELDPAVQILPKVGWYPTNAVEVTATVDLEEILSLNTVFATMQPADGGDTATQTNYYNEFKKQIDKVIGEAGLGSLNEFKITVKIPNTSNPETYTCVPGWREVVNTASGNE